ncbi:hypothetical protein ACFU67_21345 [Streptomyces rhizosphaericola]|uniref:hypothetical protein n=1 Tax=Streptomyces rhizosphaericola TaxID=2564098 RepID=UPI0036C7A925
MASLRARRFMAGIIGATLLASASPAFALSVEIDGAKASTKKKEGYKLIRVYDTKGDSNSVYGNYHRQASPSTERTLHNRGGSGTHAVSGSGSKILDQKACVSIDLWPDRCSSWVRNP